LLAGTNADLEAAVGSGRFREDLYFRLARFTIHVPPLRDRKEDIPMLMAYFLRLFSAEMGVAHPAVDPATLAALQAHDYPGNIRELKNLVERALIESDGAVIQPEHLHFTRRPHPSGKPPADSPPAGHDAHPAGHDAPGPDREEDELGRVVAYVREHGSINNSQCRQVLTVGLQHACYLLRKAHHAGLLLKKGTGRWTNYLLP
jgi:DNA-binding NtrC family response regulator